MVDSGTTTISSLDENQISYGYNLTIGTFDTKESQSELQSINCVRISSNDSFFNYDREVETINSGTGYYADDSSDCSETSSSWKITRAYRLTTDTDTLETVCSQWRSSGNGTQSTDSIEIYTGERKGSYSDENYDLNFDGVWVLTSSGDFVYAPIVVNGSPEGSRTQFFDNYVDDKHSNTTTQISYQTPFTSFYQGVRSGINTIATQINAYDVQTFGAYESVYGVHFNYPTLLIPNGQTFDNPGNRVEFGILATPTPESSEFSSDVDYEFLTGTLVPVFSEERLADLLVEEAVETEINYWNLLSLNPITRIKTVIQIVDRYSQPVLLGIGDVSEKIYEFTLKPSVDRVVTVYNNMKADPNVSGLMLTYVVVGCFIADNVGVASLSNAFDGHDYVDNRELSMGERVFEGVSGAFDLVSTAVGGLNAIKSGIRATGQCDKLGKYFTGCCFTADVQVVYCATIAVAAEENASDEPIISVENEAFSEEPSDDADVETTVQRVDDEPDAFALNEEVEFEIELTPEDAPLADDFEETTSEDVHWIAYSLLGATATAAIVAPTPKRKRGSLSCDSSPCENDSEEKEGNIDEEGSAPCATPLVKTTRAKSTALLRRAFGGWKSTVARLFVFALCISAIVALAFNSRHKSSDKLPTEHSVALSSLPIQTEDVVSVEKTAGVVDVSTVETSESDEIVFDETPIDLEIEAPTIEPLEETTSDSKALATETVFEEHSTVAESAAEESESVPLCASEASVELRTGSISEIRIGYRVPGTNPEGNDGRDESVFVNEKHVVYTLRVPKADGTFCTAKLLRSENWLYEAPTRFVSLFDGHVFNEIDAALAEMTLLPSNFYRDFEIEVWIDLADQGCVGWSKIVEIDDAFKYAPGEGNLVTGTFEHVAQDVIDLQIEGQEKPIGCTPTHPIWSVDREEFVPAGELVEGERVRVLNGDTKRVVQKLPRPGPELVYNLEVFGEHVYHVTSDGVLVHNDCPEELRKFIDESFDKYDVVKYKDVFYFYQKNSDLDPIIVGKYGLLRNLDDEYKFFGDQAHHVVRKKILELLGKDINDGISVFISKKMHYGTRTYGRSNWPKDTDIDPVQELNDDIDNLRNLFNDEQFFNVDEKYDSTLIEGVLNKIKKLNEDANINGWGQVSTSKPTLPKP